MQDGQQRGVPRGAAPQAAGAGRHPHLPHTAAPLASNIRSIYSKQKHNKVTCLDNIYSIHVVAGLEHEAGSADEGEQEAGDPGGHHAGPAQEVVHLAAGKWTLELYPLTMCIKFELETKVHPKVRNHKEGPSPG